MFQNYLILATTIIFTVIAQLLLKKFAVYFGEYGFSFKIITGLITKFPQNIQLFGSMIFWAIAFLLWVVVLSRIKLNIAYPIVTALNMSLVVLGSYFFFKENLSLVQLIGILIIVFGIFLVSWKF